MERQGSQFVLTSFFTVPVDLGAGSLGVRDINLEVYLRSTTLNPQPIPFRLHDLQDLLMSSVQALRDRRPKLTTAILSSFPDICTAYLGMLHLETHLGVWNHRGHSDYLDERSDIVYKSAAKLHFRDFEKSAGLRFVGVFYDL